MSTSTICEACLSTNRLLTLFSGSDRQVFTNILDNADYVSDPLALCWECTAVIKKVIRFKRQVQNAHRLLISSMLRQTKLLHTLSNLSHHTITPESHILVLDNTEHFKKPFSTINSRNNAIHKPSSNYILERNNSKIEKEMSNVIEREPLFIKVELEDCNNFEQELETTADLDDTAYDDQDDDFEDEEKIDVKSDSMESHDELRSDVEFNDSDEEPLKKKKRTEQKGAKNKNKTVTSDTEPLEISDSESASDNLVDPHQYNIEIKKYYSTHKEHSKKTEWTHDKINNIMKLIRECLVAKRLGRKQTNSQYHYSKKYDVIDNGKKKVLILKRKSLNDPVIKIVPSTEYHRLITAAHIVTQHGRRDTMIRYFKNKYLIPVFALTTYLRMCKVCVQKRHISTNKRIARIRSFLKFNKLAGNSEAYRNLQENPISNTTDDFTINMEGVNAQEIKFENVICNDTEGNDNEIAISFEEQNMNSCINCNEDITESNVCKKCNTITQEHSYTRGTDQDLLVPMYESQQLNGHANEVNVDKKQFDLNIQKYYSGHKQMSKKGEWSHDKIQRIIKLLQEYHKVRAMGLTPSRTQYHHASKYDVISVDNKKVLIIKRKSLADPVIQIVPSNEYYKIILETHLATHHGRRDKIINYLKNKYVVPKFAIMLFLQLCKTCVDKKYPLCRSKKFVDPLTLKYDFSDMGKLNSDNEHNVSNACSETDKV